MQLVPDSALLELTRVLGARLAPLVLLLRVELMLDRAHLELEAVLLGWELLHSRLAGSKDELLRGAVRRHYSVRYAQPLLDAHTARLVHLPERVPIFRSRPLYKPVSGPGKGHQGISRDGMVIAGSHQSWLDTIIGAGVDGLRLSP